MAMIYIFFLIAFAISEPEKNSQLSVEEMQVEEASIEIEENVEVEEQNTELIATANTDFSELKDSPTVFPDLREKTNESFTEELAQLEKYKRNYDVLGYGSLELILPGGGVAVRFHGTEWNYEGNFSIVFPAAKCSFSILRPFSTNTQGYWYAGGGIGLGALLVVTHTTSFFHPFIPVFVGYQQKRFFSDIGLDIVLDYPLLPIPTLRCGICF